MNDREQSLKMTEKYSLSLRYSPSKKNTSSNYLLSLCVLFLLFFYNAEINVMIFFVLIQALSAKNGSNINILYLHVTSN
jgi:hypothetical protein